MSRYLALLLLTACTAAPRPVEPVVYHWPEGSSPAPAEPVQSAPGDPTAVADAVAAHALKEGWMPLDTAAPTLGDGSRRFTRWHAAPPPAGSPNPTRLLQTWGWTGSRDVAWPRSAWAPDRR